MTSFLTNDDMLLKNIQNFVSSWINYEMKHQNAKNRKDKLQACISLNIFEVRFILFYDNIFEMYVDSIKHYDIK